MRSRDPAGQLCAHRPGFSPRAASSTVAGLPAASPSTRRADPAVSSSAPTNSACAKSLRNETSLRTLLEFVAVTPRGPVRVTHALRPRGPAWPLHERARRATAPLRFPGRPCRTDSAAASTKHAPQLPRPRRCPVFSAAHAREFEQRCATLRCAGQHKRAGPRGAAHRGPGRRSTWPLHMHRQHLPQRTSVVHATWSRTRARGRRPDRPCGNGLKASAVALHRRRARSSRQPLTGLRVPLVMPGVDTAGPSCGNRLEGRRLSSCSAAVPLRIAGCDASIWPLSHSAKLKLRRVPGSGNPRR